MRTRGSGKLSIDEQEQVLEVFRARQALRDQALADKFGVSIGTIRNAIKNRGRPCLNVNGEKSSPHSSDVSSPTSERSESFPSLSSA